MGCHKTKRFLVFSALISIASSAGLLESLLSWDGAEGLVSSLSGSLLTSSPVLQQAKCMCQTVNCMCCVDLNLTSAINLGGSACMNIQQKEQNVSLNLSYGDNLLHNASIKIEEAAGKPTCMSLKSSPAELCAKFVTMKPASTSSPENPAWDGCLVLEPSLNKVTQATYGMGCFNFNNAVVRQIENPSADLTTNQDSTDEEDEINADELIAAVSASAEQGIALFSQWLGFALSPKPSSEDSQIATSAPHDDQLMDTVAPQSARSSRHMNFLLEPEQGEAAQVEERFKQLLSAQDNVLKGSAKIGQPVGVPTTFLYSKPSKVEEQQKLQQQENSESQGSQDPSPVTISHENLAVVPRESRRGGRAFDIHRYNNEV